MSSCLHQYLAQSHMDDLRRSAERRRVHAAAAPADASPFPTFLRSRRLGDLLRIVPPSRRTA
ncbi:MAG: hypothetical protein QM729_12995 [Solirubrobacterales bacterium]